MSQFNAPVQRAGSSPDVYTALLVIATLILAFGVGSLAMKNIEHSAVEGESGGLFKLVE
jgi:hypothetical protein